MIVKVGSEKMTDIRKNIMKYSNIPSLSHREQGFMDTLKEDFSAFKNYRVISRKECLYVDKGAPKTIFAHIDRVPVSPYQPTISSDGKIVGQLDNLISVVACYELAKNDAEYNFLFTTHEETCDNYKQIFAYISDFPDKKIFDLDIDIGISEELIKKGCITANVFEKPELGDYFDTGILKSGILTRHNPHWNIAQMVLRFSASWKKC